MPVSTAPLAAAASLQTSASHQAPSPPAPADEQAPGDDIGEIVVEAEAPTPTPARTGAAAPAQGAISSKRRPREPILDPWSEDAEPAAPPRPPQEIITSNGDTYLVARRHPSTPQPGDEEEDEVVTSAAPLDLTLKRKPISARPPAPPAPAAARTRPATPTGNEPPGHLGASADSVPAKGAANSASDSAKIDPPASADASPAESTIEGTIVIELSDSDLEAPMSSRLAAPPPSPQAAEQDDDLQTKATPSRGEPAPHGDEVQAPRPRALDEASGEPAPEPVEELLDDADLALVEEPPAQAPAAAPRPASATDARAPASVEALADLAAAPRVGAPAVEGRRSAAGESADLAAMALDAPPSAPPETEALAALDLAPEIAPDLPGPGAASAAPAADAAALTGRDLEQIEAFADLPEEMHDELALAARVEDLSSDEELAVDGAALVLRGDAAVCANIVDIPAERAATRTLVPSRGTLEEGIPLRVVAGAEGARVAVWGQATIDHALRSCPWVLDELRTVADRIQSLAGATMGPLGELEDTLLRRVLGRLRLRGLAPGEHFIHAGNPIPGLVIIGAGALELVAERSQAIAGTARPGDLLFASELLGGQPAPSIARAAGGGALVLLADHPTLRELFESTPELLSILAQSVSMNAQRG
ncbi:cyclic nucleotide-binding domain-containing protein [Sorangium cellulosum]|uniref:cyclic nucleotide-binding domain-containing protein n=1 Tax=Sorangium cellulosum TaxID=56 RepID=UPI00138B1129|nr:cyclic nucleotide-binding domain-containing protein [Sorangium cellulosum]